MAEYGQYWMELFLDLYQINNNYYSAANSEAALLAWADSAAAKNSSITSIAVTPTCLSET